MKGVVISAMLVLAMVQFMMKPGEAISCGQVDASLAPCVPYLTNGGTPTTECCNGVKSIKGMATTPVAKRTTCNCVKDAANRYSNLKDDAAQAHPAKCNVQMDIPISRSTVTCCVRQVITYCLNI
ncbi:non-specific lipid-transfer protein 1-like [Cornus florida]|uniref:non-specific lipid-transfer protein 1-like n=1 Tax=Cornus florida TaxID=4283 RepID=UPI00289A8D37|nr:non-specific lipid-transfer protein 1-like [Cornus florida]